MAAFRFIYDGADWRMHGTLAAGQTTGRQILPRNSRPENGTVSVEPAAGGIGEVYYCLSDPDAIRAGNGVWRLWPNGAITEASTEADRDDSFGGKLTGIEIRNAGTGTLDIDVVA